MWKVTYLCVSWGHSASALDMEWGHWEGSWEESADRPSFLRPLRSYTTTQMYFGIGSRVETLCVCVCVVPSESKSIFCSVGQAVVMAVYVGQKRRSLMSTWSPATLLLLQQIRNNLLSSRANAFYKNQQQSQTKWKCVYCFVPHDDTWNSRAWGSDIDVRYFCAIYQIAQMLWNTFTLPQDSHKIPLFHVIGIWCIYPIWFSSTSCLGGDTASFHFPNTMDDIIVSMHRLGQI